MHFYHLTIITKDFEKSLRFYTEFVGLKINRSEDVPGKHKLAMLAEKPEDTQIEIVSYAAPFTAEAKGITVCFKTDDIDAMHKKAVEMELNPSDIRSPEPGLRYFYVYDPDRVSIEFKEEK